MFGPNTQITRRLSIDSNHRSVYAESLVVECRHLFQETFGLSEFDILFIPGSASVGMEAIIASLKTNVRVLGTGKFADRWRDVASRYATEERSFFNLLFCHLETSESKLNLFSIGDGVVDAISSFPFFPLPSCSFFVTSVNKQLGCPVGISVVGVRKDAWRRVQDRVRGFSYTDLYSWKGATPVTFPVYVFEVLRKNLQTRRHLSTSRRIRSVSKALRSGIGDDSIIGERVSPVITVRTERIPPDLADHYQLYRSTSGYQLFTYSCPVHFYHRFLEDLKKCS
jgi:aspartate aminotransferase-like enzyme